LVDLIYFKNIFMYYIYIMNNATKGCPPQMSDGRLFTDYRPSGDIYDHMIKNAMYQDGIANNYEFRQYLINNSLKKIEDTRQVLLNSKLCKKCSLNNPVKEFY